MTYSKEMNATFPQHDISVMLHHTSGRRSRRGQTAAVAYGVSHGGEKEKVINAEVHDIIRRAETAQLGF